MIEWFRWLCRPSIVFFCIIIGAIISNPIMLIDKEIQPPIVCPNNSHVWSQSQCPPFGGPPGSFPGTGGNGSGGLLGLVHSLTGGLL